MLVWLRSPQNTGNRAIIKIFRNTQPRRKGARFSRRSNISLSMESDLLPFQRPGAFVARLSVLLCVLLLSACATRPPASKFARTPSHAIATTEATDLGQALADDEKTYPKLSGFKLLRTGNEALQTRLALIESAQKTLDL